MIRKSRVVSALLYMLFALFLPSLFASGELPDTNSLDDGQLHCLPASDEEVDELKKYKFPPALGVNMDLRNPEYDFENRAHVRRSEMNEMAGVQIKQPLSKLPEPYSLVGNSGCTFGLFSNDKPEAYLEPGDIMVEFDPAVTKTPRELYRKLVHGMIHTAFVAAKKDGGLEHLETGPSNNSNDNFSNYKSFHVLRLRRIPKEIKSDEELKSWLADPSKRQTLKQFLGLRKCRIAMASVYGRLILEKGYNYKIGGNPLKKDPEAFRKAVVDSNLKLDLYCSPFPAGLYSMHGTTAPQSRSIARLIEIADQFLEKSRAKTGVTRETAAQQVAYQLAAEKEGVSKGLNSFLYRILVDVFADANDEKTLAKIQSVLSQSAAQMKESLPGLGGDVGYLDPNTIGPSDVFDQVYDPNSDFVYSHTHLRNMYVVDRDRGFSREIHCDDGSR